MTINLDEFFAPTDIQELRARCLESEGIDLLGLYCLHTGKQIGTFDPSELEFAADDESVEDESELIDALLVRIVASMRPSPALNKPDIYTIRELSSKRPVDALSYLANRLYGSRDLLAKRTDSSFSPLIARIALHRQWSELHAKGVDLTPWIHWLLEIDSKMNLHDLNGPRVSVDRLNKLISTRDGAPLFSFVTVENHKSALACFESWAFEKLAEYGHSQQRELREANWARGNSMTRTAFYRSWLENPEIANRKEAERVAKAKKAEANKAKPGRPVSEKTRLQNEKVNLFLGLLGGILESNEPIEQVTYRKPKVMSMGALLKKVESN